MNIEDIWHRPTIVLVIKRHVTYHVTLGVAPTAPPGFPGPYRSYTTWGSSQTST